MALIDNRAQRMTMLCAMYLAQGIPWGFMTIALISYLTERGVGDAQAGELTAIVLLPWTFKLIWAPMIDTMTVRSMGRRRPWIIGAELMMALSLLGILAAGDLTENLRLLGWMFFVHNVFSSLQDVSTDALAVDILPYEEQGRTNGLMWGTKLIGKGIGATVMAHIIDAWGLPAAVLAQMIVLLVIMLRPCLSATPRSGCPALAALPSGHRQRPDPAQHVTEQPPVQMSLGQQQPVVAGCSRPCSSRGPVKSGFRGAKGKPRTPSSSLWRAAAMRRSRSGR